MLQVRLFRLQRSHGSEPWNPCDVLGRIHRIFIFRHASQAAEAEGRWDCRLVDGLSEP